MARATAFVGEFRRRPWFQLEDRHGGILVARVIAAAALAIGAMIVPGLVLPRDSRMMVGACVVAALLHLALWSLPVRWPRRLRLAVNLSLVVDASWATIMAAASGGSRSPLVGLYLITSLWAALGYSARTGVKGGILASLGFLTLVWFDDGHLWSAASLGCLVLFWSVLASAVMGAAAGERELRVRAERLSVLHAAAQGLLAAADAEAMAGVARAAGAALLPDWRVSVRTEPADVAVRLVRSGAEGIVVVPVIVAGRPAGAIECRRLLPTGRVWHRIRLREISALETLSAALGSALWRADLLAGMERLSLTDALTGIGNRRAFDEELGRRVAGVQRSGGGVALCLVDIDWFKSFNDTLGHQIGDKAIAAVAAAVRESCRTSDIPARYGGEEIAVIMPGLSREDAVLAAERMRLAVAATEVAGRALSVSIGVAATAGGCSAELLVETADRALYDAKRGGRNRVASGTVGPEEPVRL